MSTGTCAESDPGHHELWDSASYEGMHAFAELSHFAPRSLCTLLTILSMVLSHLQGWTKAEAQAEEVKLSGKSKTAKSGASELPAPDEM